MAWLAATTSSNDVEIEFKSSDILGVKLKIQRAMITHDSLRGGWHFRTSESHVWAKRKPWIHTTEAGLVRSLTLVKYGRITLKVQPLQHECVAFFKVKMTIKPFENEACPQRNDNDPEWLSLFRYQDMEIEIGCCIHCVGSREEKEREKRRKER